MPLFRNPVPLPTRPGAAFSSAREGDTLKALSETQQVVSRLTGMLAPYFPGLDVTDVTGQQVHALAFTKGQGPLPGPQLHNVSGLTAGLTDPFDIAGSVLDSVLGSISVPDPAVFISTLAGYFTTALGTVESVGSAPSRATVETLVNTWLGSLSGLVGDIGTALTAELSSRAGGIPAILEAYFSAEGAPSPRNGDYIYSEATGIVYTIFRQKGGIPSANTIFRVPFDVNGTTWVALTTFPAPNIAGLLQSVADLVLNAVNSLMSLLSALIVNAIMALFELITAIWPLITAMIEAAIAILMALITALQTALALLTGRVAAIEAILDAAPTVHTTDLSGNDLTIKVLESSTGGDTRTTISWLNKHGAQQEAKIIFWDATTITDGTAKFRQSYYLDHRGGRVAMRIMNSETDGYPKGEDQPGGELYKPFEVITCDNGEMTILKKDDA